MAASGLSMPTSEKPRHLSLLKRWTVGNGWISLMPGVMRACNLTLKAHVYNHGISLVLFVRPFVALGFRFQHGLPG